MDFFVGIAILIIVFITGMNIERILKNIERQNKEIINLLRAKK